MKRNPKLEVLHLFRWFTHTPRCPGAFPEDAKPVTDQIDQSASKLQLWLPPKKKLNDGWPESVEKQGLLLLVLRHYITRQYVKDIL